MRRKHLQRATESPQSYLVHYLYAFVLSREGLSANRPASPITPRETAALIRDQLLKSIKLASSYAPSALSSGGHRSSHERTFSTKRSRCPESAATRPRQNEFMLCRWPRSICVDPNG
jgi:hypothetical protein